MDGFEISRYDRIDSLGMATLYELALNQPTVPVLVSLNVSDPLWRLLSLRTAVVEHTVKLSI